MTKKEIDYSNIFYWVNVKVYSKGKKVSNKVTCRTIYGEIDSTWIKMKGISIEDNLCGFCLN